MGDQGSAAQYTENEQAISFREVVGRLWAGRVLLVLLPLLAACAGLIFILATQADDRQIISYHVKLIGIENGTYPNGTAFSPNDLKSSAALAELSEKFDIPAAALESAVRVNYDNPAAAGITLKYQQKLAARNLAPAVIDSINTAYTDELAASVNSGLRIEIRNGLLNLPFDDAAALALAVPSAWNETYLKRHRVLSDTKLTEAAITPIPETVSGTTRLIVVGEQLDKIETGLKLIGDDNRLAGLMTSEGLTAEDMKNLVAEFRTVYFDPLVADGFSPDDPVAVSQKKSLQRRVDDLKRQIDGLDQNLGRLMGEPPAHAAEAQSAQGPGLEQGVLDTVVTLVKRATFMDYAQDLLDQRQRIVEEWSATQAHLDAFILNPEADRTAPTPELTGLAESKLKVLALHYRDLFSAAQKQLVETSGRFYSEVSTPTASGRQSLFGTSEIILASTLAGLLAAILYVLGAPSVRAALRTTRSSPPASIRMVASSERLPLESGVGSPGPR